MSRKRASEVIICQRALARGRKLPDYELVKQNELELVHVGPRASVSAIVTSWVGGKPKMEAAAAGLAHRAKIRLRPVRNEHRDCEDAFPRPVQLGDKAFCSRAAVSLGTEQSLLLRLPAPRATSSNLSARIMMA
jgi:hypothetical protein